MSVCVCVCWCDVQCVFVAAEKKVIAKSNLIIEVKPVSNFFAFFVPSFTNSLPFPLVER